MNQQETDGCLTPGELAQILDTITKSAKGLKFGEVNICLKFHNGKLAKSLIGQARNWQINIS